MSSSSDQLSDVPLPTGSVQLSTSLEELQSDEQRRVLDIVAQIRKYGLQGDLSLPQIIVCGDQSAGKSSVLEALTEIPFPRSDSLCTRFATEITLSFNYYMVFCAPLDPKSHSPPADSSRRSHLFAKLYSPLSSSTLPGLSAPPYRMGTCRARLAS